MNSKVYNELAIYVPCRKRFLIETSNFSNSAKNQFVILTLKLLENLISHLTLWKEIKIFVWISKHNNEELKLYNYVKQFIKNESNLKINIIDLPEPVENQWVWIDVKYIEEKIRTTCNPNHFLRIDDDIHLIKQVYSSEISSVWNPQYWCLKEQFSNFETNAVFENLITSIKKYLKSWYSFISLISWDNLVRNTNHLLNDSENYTHSAGWFMLYENIKEIPFLPLQFWEDMYKALDYQLHWKKIKIITNFYLKQLSVNMWISKKTKESELELNKLQQKLIASGCWAITSKTAKDIESQKRKSDYIKEYLINHFKKTYNLDINLNYFKKNSIIFKNKTKLKKAPVYVTKNYKKYKLNDIKKEEATFKKSYYKPTKQNILEELFLNLWLNFDLKNGPYKENLSTRVWFNSQRISYYWTVDNVLIKRWNDEKGYIEFTKNWILCRVENSKDLPKLFAITARYLKSEFDKLLTKKNLIESWALINWTFDLNNEKLISDILVPKIYFMMRKNPGWLSAEKRMKKLLSDILRLSFQLNDNIPTHKYFLKNIIKKLKIKFNLENKKDKYKRISYNFENEDKLIKSICLTIYNYKYKLNQ